MTGRKGSAGRQASDTPDLAALIGPARELAHGAGRLALRFFQEGSVKVDYKSDRSPVTAAGQAVLECASGAVINLQGQSLRYRKPSILNPPFIASGDPEHERLVPVPPPIPVAPARGSTYNTQYRQSAEHGIHASAHGAMQSGDLQATHFVALTS